MDALDNDFDILLDDYERAVALESLGVSNNNPAMRAMAKRWLIGQEFVGVESMMRKEVIDGANVGLFSIPANLIDGAADLTVSLSAALLDRMHSWLAAKEEAIKAKIADAVSKTSGLERELVKLEPKMLAAEMTKTKQIKTGSWTSKLCVEDKLNVKECIEFAEKPTILDDMAKSYMVFTSIGKEPTTRNGEELSLRKLGKSTGWALKRSKGLMGLAENNTRVEAWPMAGNVIVTLRGNPTAGQVFQFAVAREGEYGETIDSLDKVMADKALKAARSLTGSLRDRNVKRGLFSYSGIYDKVEELKKEASDDTNKAAAIKATKRLKNSLAVEDAITTAMVRVCEGLIKYIKLSL